MIDKFKMSTNKYASNNFGSLLYNVDGETALSLLMGFLSFIGMVIMITYTVSKSSLFFFILYVFFGWENLVFS